MSVPTSILNKLPKDVLIYLFETVQHKQKVENNFLKMILSQFSEIGDMDIQITKCNSECDHLYIEYRIYSKSNVEIFETACGKGYKCDYCKKYRCAYHRDNTCVMLVHKTDKMYNCGPICEGECFDEYTSPERFNLLEEFDIVPMV